MNIGTIEARLYGIRHSKTLLIYIKIESAKNLSKMITMKFLKLKN